MVKLRGGLSTENLDSANDKISEGLKIDQHVQKAVLESGVTADSPLYKLCPKIAGYYWRAKVTILQNHIFTDLGVGTIYYETGLSFFASSTGSRCFVFDLLVRSGINFSPDKQCIIFYQVGTSN